MIKAKVIAIDGPSGSGKSTIAKEVSSELNILYIDTGSMFRALGYICDKNSIKFQESDELKLFLNSLDINYGESKDCLISINGENLTEIIREHRVSELASKISSIPSVRSYLLKLQQQIASTSFCVMEGRDIGTVVFPNSFCKVFLTATPEVRAQRRLDQLKEKGSTELTFDQILKDVKDRDYRDINRDEAPLKQAEDAIRLDTTELNLKEVIQEIKKIVLKQAEIADLKL